MSRFRRIAALWCLTSVLCGQVVQAQTLLVMPKEYYSGGVGNRQASQQAKRNYRLITSLIRLTGGTVDRIENEGTKTEWVRTGQQVYNMGTGTPAAPGAGAYVRQYYSVIQLGPPKPYVAKAGAARFDSLTRALVQKNANTLGHAVPMLYLRDNAAKNALVSAFNDVADSTGVTGQDNGPGKAIYFANDRNAFLTHAYVVGATGAFDTGDMRKILFGGTPKLEYELSASDDNLGIRACRQCDSLMSYAANDTLILWDRQYGSRIQGARTITFASAWGAGQMIDSLLNQGYGDYGEGWPPTEGDFAVMLAALAHLDSLVRADTSATGQKRGGKVLGDKVIRIAPVVYGGLARGERHAWRSPGSAQGILASDTSAFYAILDSVAALGIPITFAINPDSASTYARDLIKMKQNPFARFTPQVWNGISDSTKAGGQDAKYRPVDVFGRYRNRTAMGAGTGLGADTGSVYTLAKTALRLVDSLTNGRVSRIAVAPDDDWSPLNVNGVLYGANRVPIDSVLYALQQAGFRGIVADAQDPDASGSNRKGGPAATNPRGFYQRQQVYSSGSVTGLRNFKILTHTGYSIMGGRAQQISPIDSLYPYNLGGGAYTPPFLIYKELARAWSGALFDFDNSYDTWPYDDISNPFFRDVDNIYQRKVDRTQAAAGRPVVRGNVYRIACADLSGRPDGPPAANGYHVLKAMRNAMLTINKLAGRTVVTFAYPEDIEP